MRSLRDPLLDAELNPNRKSSLWHFATAIMVVDKIFFLSFPKQQIFNKENGFVCVTFQL